MIKPGYILWATYAGRRWFVKQAKSAMQFRRMCLEDERKHGFPVPPRERDNYIPDFRYNETRKIWIDHEGNPYGPKLPLGAPGNPLPRG